MINNIYTYDKCILLTSIYQIHNLFFYINAHKRKFWTKPVTESLNYFVYLVGLGQIKND